MRVLCAHLLRTFLITTSSFSLSMFPISVIPITAASSRCSVILVTFLRCTFQHRSCGHHFYDLFAKLLKHRRHARNLLACTDRTRKGGQCIVVLLPFWDQFCCYLCNHGTSRGSILRNRQFSKTLLFATTEILDSFSNTFYQCRFVQIVENKTTRDTYE